MKIQSVQPIYDSAILLASYGTLSTGVNIKNLHNLVLCHPLKAKIKTLQSIGRILRTAESKNTVTLIDIVDDFSYESGRKRVKLNQNIVLRHFYERLKIYESEDFNYSIIEHKLT